MLTGKAVDAGSRRGRPPGTSRRELELIALRLFTGQGFDNTTIEQIAAEAGVSRRTFFRYFGSKASVLWSELGFLALFALVVFLLATRKLNQKLV